MKSIFLFTLLSLLLIGSKAQQYDWTVYTTSNSGLPNDATTRVKIDGNGNKWIITMSFGLVKYDGLNWIVYTSQNSGLPSMNLKDIEVAPNGDIWISTGDSGLVKFDGSNWVIYNTQNSGISYDYLEDIFIEPNGTVWIGSGPDLDRFDGVNWTYYDMNNSGLNGFSVLTAALDASGNNWFGTFTGFISKFDGTNWTVYDSSNTCITDATINDISVATNGDIWVGGYYDGVIKFDGTTWQSYNPTNSTFPGYTVNVIEFTPNGDIWAGTKWAGLAKFDGQNWISYTTQNSGLPYNTIEDIAIEANGDVWLATTLGLVRISQCPSPPSSISVSSNPSQAIYCPNQPVVLSAVGAASSYIWSDGSLGQSILVTSAGTYNVTGNNSNSQWCPGTSSSVITIQQYALPHFDDLCLVTVDTATGKNRLIWNKTNNVRTDSFIFYKETSQPGVYAIGGTQNFNSFSTWIDWASNPSVQNDRYYLSVLDSCANQSKDFNNPTAHRTILLSSSQGQNGENQLIWTNYEGLTFNSYNILRSNNFGAFNSIGSVPYTQLTYTDSFPPLGNNRYLIEVAIQIPCTPSLKTSEILNSTSNIESETNVLTNLYQFTLSEDDLKVQPNPNNGNFILEVPEWTDVASVSIFDLLGKEINHTAIRGTNFIQIETNDIPAGVYQINILTSSQLLSKKWIKK